MIRFTKLATILLDMVIKVGCEALGLTLCLRSLHHSTSERWHVYGAWSGYLGSKRDTASRRIGYYKYFKKEGARSIGRISKDTAS
jgi:hypothetical protein